MISKFDRSTAWHVKVFLLGQIDLTQPLVPQGPFDVIVHKLSDVIVEAEHDSQSQQLLANFQVRLHCERTSVLNNPWCCWTNRGWIADCVEEK